MPENGYFRAKLAQESLIEKSSIPFSIVHATQFDEFVRGIADTSTVDGRVRIAPVYFQPIAGVDVARNVAKVAMGEPLNGRLEIAGPERYQMDEFFRTALAGLGDPREVVTDEHALYFGSEVTQQSLVPTGAAVLGEVTYAEWLAAQTEEGK
jgi:uncharacterized protein YbjT (DUF2867 family)